VIATGESRSVEEFVVAAFGHAGLNWREYVETDPVYFRPAEVDLLKGDSSKAKAQLGWEAQTRFPELVRILVDADIKLLDDQLARGELANEYSN
jgi:GDPmannose 4,6-dehydratase